MPVLTQFEARAPAQANDIAVVEVELQTPLPEDYKAFLLKQDGGEGFIGEHYLVLWSIAELLPFNRDYQFQELAPGLIAFGSNGGGEGFAFDAACEGFRVKQCPFIGLSREDAMPVAQSFTHLLERMIAEEGSLF
ncbi:MAG TPA: SMI1/KNR4 family protein [Sphingomonadaceae bacterium]|nr:SMI1/KNR4 family protein [Sphingomonadaceae bacterium]